VYITYFNSLVLYGSHSGILVFTGGTGRFQQAQGSADFTVTQDLNSGTFDVVAQGQIDY
jgi:hypothetical protein